MFDCLNLAYPTSQIGELAERVVQMSHSTFSLKCYIVWIFACLHFIQYYAEMQKAASMASALVLFFPPAVLIFGR